jgi:uncharacterized protein YkwD
MRSVARILAVAASCAATLAAAAPAHAAKANCPQATVAAAAVSGATAAKAVQCLVNAERAARRLPAVRSARHLRVAAQRHAADMVARRYFAHDSLDGRSLLDRVKRAGYLSGARRYSLGENIGWGEQHLSSARAIVQAWMHSPGHKAIILDRRFTEAGVGIAFGVPMEGGGQGATYVLDVGRRA